MSLVPKQTKYQPLSDKWAVYIQYELYHYKLWGWQAMRLIDIDLAEEPQMFGDCQNYEQAKYMAECALYEHGITHYLLAGTLGSIPELFA